MNTNITPKTLCRFLLCRRDAIEAIASSRRALLIGLLFIISAGLARNYDHHILSEEPLWIGGPLFMTFFSSSFIFLFVRAKRGFDGSAGPFGNYLAFLSCFVMTAPLAWLYGIPVEQFTTAVGATVFNFIALMIVAAWRVVIMITVVRVLFGCSLSRAFAAIAFPAAVEMFFATMVQSVNIVGIMGGMHLNESQKFLLAALDATRIGSVLLGIMAFVAWMHSWHQKQQAFAPKSPCPRVTHPTWGLAVVSVLAWFTFALPFQKKLRLHTEVIEHFRNENFPALAALLKDKSRENFLHHRSLFGRASVYWPSLPALSIVANPDGMPEWVIDDAEASLRAYKETASHGGDSAKGRFNSVMKQYLEEIDNPADLDALRARHDFLKPFPLPD